VSSSPLYMMHGSLVSEGAVVQARFCCQHISHFTKVSSTCCVLSGTADRLRCRPEFVVSNHEARCSGLQLKRKHDPSQTVPQASMLGSLRVPRRTVCLHHQNRGATVHTAREDLHRHDTILPKVIHIAHRTQISHCDGSCKMILAWCSQAMLHM
jgi:hypothetical protein